MASNVNPSGLNDEECQEFHKYFIQGYLLWAVGAFFAHMRSSRHARRG